MADTDEKPTSTRSEVAFWIETIARGAIPFLMGIADIARTWGESGLAAARAHADAKVKEMDLANARSKSESAAWRKENDGRAAALPPRPVAPEQPPIDVRGQPPVEPAVKIGDVVVATDPKDVP